MTAAVGWPWAERVGNAGDLVRAYKGSRGSSGRDWMMGHAWRYDDPGKEQPTYTHTTQYNVTKKSSPLVSVTQLGAMFHKVV